MKFDKKLKRQIILWSVGGPVLVNILMWIPSFNLAATHSTENWLGFFGNYSGGIVGGVVAWLIAKSQVDHEKEERKKEQLDQEAFAANIVQIFLFDELRNNLKAIHGTLLEALKMHSTGELVTGYVWGKRNFDYEVYNEIKFELIKYNNPFVRETIEAYKTLKEFERVDRINDISKKEAGKYYETFNHWIIKLGDPFSE